MLGSQLRLLGTLDGRTSLDSGGLGLLLGAMRVLLDQLASALLRLELSSPFALDALRQETQLCDLGTQVEHLALKNALLGVWDKPRLLELRMRDMPNAVFQHGTELSPVGAAPHQRHAYPAEL